MKKNLLWMAAAILTCGLAFTACSTDDIPANGSDVPEQNPNEWTIDFFALSQKYADKVGLTITAAVYDNVGTTSIVNGALKETAEDGSTTASEELDPRFAVQSGTNWFFYTNKGKTGLYQGNGGGRTFGVLDVKADQTITIEVTEQPSIKSGDIELFTQSDSSFVYYVKSDCNVVFNLARYNVISKISVEDFVGAEYTVKFVDSTGKKVKDDVKHKGAIGQPVTLFPSDIAPINLEDGSRLVFQAASNSETNVVKKDGSTVITVLYRPAEKYYAVLNCMAGSTLLYRFNDAEKYWFYEGDALTIHPARCYGKDGAYYVTPATTWNGTQVQFPGTITPTVSGGKTYYIATQSYELDESIVYFANFEDLALPKEDAGNGTGLGQLEGTVTNWWNWTNAVWERLDCGRGITLGDDSYVWTEPIATEGTYTVTIYGRNNIYYQKEGYEVTNPYKIGLRDAEGKVTYLDVEVPAWGASTTGTIVIENVTIPAGSSLVIYNDGAKITAKDGTELVKDITLDDITVTKPAAAE